MTTPSEIKENIRKAYNNIADTYLEWTSPTHETRLHYLNLLLKELNLDASVPASKENLNPNESKSILELGCGAGIPVTAYLTKIPNLSITANDISESQISLAKSRLPASDLLTLVTGDMMELTFPPASFDAVTGFYSIIHLPRDEQRVLLSRIGDWVKSDGYLLANFSGGEFEGEVNREWLGGKEGEMFWSGWGREEIKRILEEVGFEVLVDEVKVDEEGLTGEGEGGVKEVPFHWVLAKKSHIGAKGVKG